ncbi:MAG TPA: pyrroline-5-carboxylate reductase [Acidobacteriota bacterium]|nr:pyrroline-5-carboxylate reductase [Acidobacteriota bacterium]HMZ79893.1 pyrroline-5-carboxylate reductase [Acidobacteriota bacterium]HNB71890.1 pyrroline-5-carboxylate reductase [Acidobacteriota bacterium]HNC44600.1 pyrroline-5-carboxylate reductase [Acidobacteriota bacterium]HND19282.1 pyrroline-5-carboxylate reductase [Acidobacteriota bacterium]
MLRGKKIAIIGAGKLGEALVTGLLHRADVSREDITGTVGHEASLTRVSNRLGIGTTLDNRLAVEGRDVILLAVKPQNMDRVLAEIRPVVNRTQLFISVAASVTTSFIEERLPAETPVIRVMPNTPALLNEGMSVLCQGKHVTPDQLKIAETIFSAVGRTAFLDEKLMDAVTGLSGSGPAYIYVVIESLAEAGVKLGIPRDISTLLVAQTMLGASRMALETGQHPALLKDSVTTPAGCTIDGLLELEEGKLRVTLIKAVVKAAERARELVRTE